MASATGCISHTWAAKEIGFGYGRLMRWLQGGAQKGFATCATKRTCSYGECYGNSLGVVSIFGVQGYVGLKSDRFWGLGGILMIQGFFILGGC